MSKSRTRRPARSAVPARRLAAEQRFSAHVEAVEDLLSQGVAAWPVADVAAVLELPVRHASRAAKALTEIGALRSGPTRGYYAKVAA